MRIESIRAVEVGLPRLGSTCWVEVTTEDGRVGWGQSGAWGHPAAVAAIVARLAPLLIGADARRIELLWAAMNRALPFRGNLLAAAIAAIDIALWDLAGLRLGVPVHELLGGASRDRVRAHVIVRGGDPVAISTAVAAAVEAGFTAVKYDPLVGEPDGITTVARRARLRDMAAAGREAAGDADLIFDLHRRLDPASAIAACTALAEFAPLYIEDPLQIDSLDRQADLAARVSSPMAVGERLSSLWEFRELLGRGVPLVLRPDIGLAGGVTAGRKIAALAEAHHLRLSPHNFLGPGITAATLHLCTVIPNLLTMEYDLVDESDDSRAVVSAVRRSGGFLSAGDSPGIGVTLDSAHAILTPATVIPLDLSRLLDADGGVRDTI